MSIVKKYKFENKEKKFFYQVQIQVGGVKLDCQNFDKRASAAIWYEEQRKKIIESLQEQLDQHKSNYYFSDCFKKYVKEAVPLLSRSGRESYICRFRYFVKGPLPRTKMGAFKARTVYQWIEWLKKHDTSKNPRRKTFLRELELLQTILSWYRNFVDEDFNVPITKKHKQLCYYKPVPLRRPDYYAKPKELRAFIKWLRENNRNPVYWKLALFMVLTGSRVSEACGLCWDCVDLERGQAWVIQKMGWDHRTKKPYLEKTTKTDASVRILLLPKELISVLKEMKKESNNERRLIFVTRNNLWIKYNAIQLAFNTGFRALNLPWRSTHILRHSYATGALIATQNISTVQATLGHTTSRMTEKYAKVIALLDKKIAEKIARFFDIFNKNGIQKTNAK